MASSLFYNISRTLSWSLRVGCTVHFIHSNIYEFSETQGESMLPTLNYAGDFVHTDKTCKRGKDCHVGDVVVLLKPSDPSQRVCKRITGLAGDYIQVDPSAVEHEAASEIGVDTRRFIKVPEGHCWVTGDNLSQSLDSRSYGVIPLALIKGRIFGVHSTSGEFRWIENNLIAA